MTDDEQRKPRKRERTPAVRGKSGKSSWGAGQWRVGKKSKVLALVEKRGVEGHSRWARRGGVGATREQLSAGEKKKKSTPGKPYRKKGATRPYLPDRYPPLLERDNGLDPAIS